ncbi:hypothetical protein B0H13DRAFT_1076235 [Mycena leptocephala]|nr:hypothetical protein B0H13DRAFT_1076235 [Mycena leptocephala]
MLKTKYSSYTKLKKPTGDAECPPKSSAHMRLRISSTARPARRMLTMTATSRTTPTTLTTLMSRRSSSRYARLLLVEQPVHLSVLSCSCRRRRSQQDCAQSRPGTLRVRDEAGHTTHLSDPSHDTIHAGRQPSRPAHHTPAGEQHLKRDRDRSEMEHTWAMRLEAAMGGRRPSSTRGRSRSPSHDRCRGRHQGRTSYEEGMAYSVWVGRCASSTSSRVGVGQQCGKQTLHRMRPTSTTDPRKSGPTLPNLL